MAGGLQKRKAPLLFHILLQQIVRLLIKTAALKIQSGENGARDLSK